MFFNFWRASSSVWSIKQGSERRLRALPNVFSGPTCCLNEKRHPGLK